MIDAHFQLLMNHLVCESAHGRGEMSVVIQVEAEMAFVGIQITSVDSKLLDMDGFVKQKLFQTVVQGLLLEEQFEFVLEMHHIICFEFYSEI